jgi:glycosyltransferase involved in cell wall biosynthesis
MPQGYLSFSVIIPAYNAEATLVSTLVSVETSFAAIKARHPGVQGEAIIVNDCSKDRTRDLASQFCREHPEFMLLDAPENRGAGPARNFGVAHSHGELILFCDADDLWFEQHLTRCVSFMASAPEFDGVKTGVYTKEKLHPHFERVIEVSNPINLCVRRTCHDFIEGFPEDPFYKVQGGEDTAYILLLAQFFKIQFLTEKTVEYVRRPGNAFDRQLSAFQKPPAPANQLTLEESQILEQKQNLRQQRLDRILAKAPTPMRAVHQENGGRGKVR